MIESVANLGFYFYLVISCIFAPIDSDKFTLDVYENAKLVASFPVHRTETGFTIYGSQEEKSSFVVITKKDGVYSIEANGDNHAIDNNKTKIKPLTAERNYTRNIQSSEITFELTKKERKVFQIGNEKCFVIKESQPVI